MVRADGRGTSLTTRLADAGFSLTEGPDPTAAALLVLGPTGDGPLLAAAERGTPVLLVGAEHAGSLWDAAGLVPGRVLPAHDVRVRPGRSAGEVAQRLPGDELVLHDRWPLQDKVADDVEQLLTANSAFCDHPVATWRPATCVGTLTLGSADRTLDDPAFARLVFRVLRHVLGLRDAPPVRVGMLGYGAIGHEHAAAIGSTAGLELAAVCDPVEARVAAARAYAPGLRGHTAVEGLLADDGVDLVVVSTPPNTHAEQVLRALEAGKHVVVEKPFCLTVEEADRQIAAADAAGLALAVYQNRRWDVDYLALKAAVRAGRLGEVFHVETFVGGYDHPCNFWHSDAEISGGAIYDWGSHYLDWVLDLLPQPVEWVSATAHKRVWHDVTNADHTRVLLHFADGAEAEFTHSDLAAARKPKFYVLGTTGALVGDWQQERIVSRSPVGLVAEDRFAVSDAPAALSLHGADGSVTRLPSAAAPAQPFHRELADTLLSGWPMSVTPQGSRRNIAVMQAATQSAAEGGRPVPVPA
ncbi:MAG: GH109 [uncultured Frankineae bacterium]|uniref:GH109 n=1 Tax=uncultured Frankineae bacterium TaxID=437475 RepID=A0A6J4KT00_9ACTN|nr:MAG: GH109 [uncultured Frankineae bacterium]